MNPAVIEPSHMPKMRRTTNRPAKFLHAAWLHSATPHTKIFMLHADVSSAALKPGRAPHLIHFPTGNRCSARFCGYSKTR